MILNFLKRALLPRQALLLVFSFLLFLPSFFNPIALEYQGHLNPAYSVVVYWLKDYPILVSSLAFGLILILAWVLNRLAYYFDLQGKTNCIAAFLFLMSASFKMDFSILSPGLFAGLFLVFALYQVKVNANPNGMYLQSFNSAFLIGLGSLFYFPNIWFLSVLWVGLIAIRQLSMRSFISSICGVILVYLYLFSYYFFTDQFAFYIREYALYFTDFLHQNDWIGFSSIAYGFFGLSVLFGGIALFGLNQTLIEGTQIQRSGIKLLRMAFVFSLPILFLSGDLTSAFMLISISIAIISGAFLNSIQMKSFSDVVLIFWLLLLFVNNFNLVL